ncbi:MAG: hypothetical protein ACRDLV_01350, partial [Solirubrobacteraceae bacterium]
GHLDGWSQKLAGYRSRNQSYQQGYDDLSNQRSVAVSSESEARTNHDTAANEPPSSDPTAQRQHESWVHHLFGIWNDATRVLNKIENEIGSLVNLAEQLFQEFEHEAAGVANAVRNDVDHLDHVLVAAGAAAATIVGSGVAGLIRDGESLASRVGSGVERDAEEAGEWVLHAGESAWNAELQGLDYTYGAFVRPFLKDAGVVLAFAQLAALAIPVFGELAEPFIDLVSLADSTAMLEGDAAMALQHERGYDASLLESDGVREALSLIPGGKDAKLVGKIFGKEAKPAEKLVQAVEHLKPIERLSTRLSRIDHSQPVKRLLSHLPSGKVAKSHGIDPWTVIDSAKTGADITNELLAPDPPVPPAPSKPFILPLPTGPVLVR